MAAAIRSVWAANFDEESKLLKDIAKEATHVGFNVQYPGCITRTKSSTEDAAPGERYALVRANVNPLQPLQVGLAVRTSGGRLVAWQFNLCDFDIASHGCYRRAPDSMAYLASRGVDFWALKYDGINGYRLRWLLRDSGLINTRPHWVTFAGAFHTAYFLKMMIGEFLPPEIDRFMFLVRQKIGGHVYDVKLMAKKNGYRGPLKHIANQLSIAPMEMETETGQLAGTAAVLALQAFEVLKDKMGSNTDEYRNTLCGLQVP
ncbi:hypothetical protein BS78_06G199900 [Paspalum vaginatum]|nr:hypothetical protein BS78_06G199900 [Paspalum vaginatum]